MANIQWTPDKRKTKYNAFLRRDGASNNGFYSFGGKVGVRGASSDQHMKLNPVFRDYDGNIRDRDLTIYPKDPLQRVQDYTKNISQSIFSPGCIVKEQKFLGRQTQITKLRDSIRQG